MKLCRISTAAMRSTAWVRSGVKGFYELTWSRVGEDGGFLAPITRRDSRNLTISPRNQALTFQRRAS